MPSLRRNEGESLEAWDARMAADWEDDEPAPKKLADMTPAQLRTAEAEIMRTPPYLPQPPADLAGRHIDHMTPHERARCAQALGIAHLFPTFR